MDNRLKALLIALGEVGQKEITGGENKRIIEYHSYTSLKAKEDEIPWCAAFVNWTLAMAGINGTNSAAAKSFLNWGTATDTPSKGCIVIFDRGNNPAQGHVGFYISETPTHIYVLGGNQNDEVNISKYPKSKLKGYRVY